MASASSSEPISYEYEVFLSFRGEDTRNSFTDHLYKALLQAGIRAFRDDDEIREGEDLKPEIERSIIQSRASIIVISENFANSSWCLDELCLILQQKRNRRHFVLPVFYKVDPSDVRNQRGSFMIEANKGVEGSKWTQNNVNRWKTALTEVADLKGMVVSGSESAFITDIVHKVYSELDLKLLYTPTDLTGIETRAAYINSWLKNEESSSSVLAICGMGGIGKTTLAKYIYNSNKQNFECSSFLEGIENQPTVLLGLQKQLIKDILGINPPVSNVFEGTSHIKKAIQMKKALIVVDDIDDCDQLTTLFGTEVLHTQSKIIVTTRLLNINKWNGSISHGCLVHKINLLNNHESLELFCFHAFGSKIPMKDFEELALQLAQYCGGNPLGLKVLGSSLQGTTRIEAWISMLNSLNSLKGDLDKKLQCVLQKSFDTLPCDSHKELFLHIGCLFLHEFENEVTRILEDDYHAESGMVILYNRCLITLSRTGQLAMHKLLQDMARKIVRNSSNDPAKHSRVWRHDECCSLLRKGDGSETIEGLKLDMLQAKQGMRSEDSFETTSIAKMKNLKYLHLNSVKLIGSYENFPELIWLRWIGCNLKTIPPGLLMSSLVAIDMRFGNLEEFEPPMVLNSLKSLDLSFSYKLVSIRNLHRLPKLGYLLLCDCTSLTYVCETIGKLENLSILNLGGCTKLWKALSNQKKLANQQDYTPLFSLPQSLCILNLAGQQCTKLWKALSNQKKFVNQQERSLFSLPQSLRTLFLAKSQFEMLPGYVGLKMLTTLDLVSCPKLKSLTCLPSTLTVLNVDWCSSLRNITFQSARFTLQAFTYEGCLKLCEIEGLFKLVSVSELREADLGNMQWIKAYQDHKVDLIGDDITGGRTFNIQMLYEYGIRSTYLQGIKDQSMVTHDYASSSSFLSFRVPSHSKKNRIRGLDLTILYSVEVESRRKWNPFVKVSNKTKGVSWVYNPVVFCKTIFEKDVVWLSYWPIGNVLDVGDEVHVSIFIDTRSWIVKKEFGASLVYADDGEEEKCDERMKVEEVIGGDLSFFEVTQGGYYLCRKDFFNSVIPACFFGYEIQIAPDSRRWRECERSSIVMQEWNAFQNPNRDKYEVTLGVSFNSENEIDKIEKAVSNVMGVEHVLIEKEIGRLTVCGCFNFQQVVTCVKEFEKIVQVLDFIKIA